ncbi:MAG: hypothetical protein ACLP4V_23105 [Methylocella sp.]
MPVKLLALRLAPVTVLAAINDAIGTDKGRDPVAEIYPGVQWPVP